ncbi:hypothetical protein FRC00_012052, partial [Tulasnella sp. 408]
MSYSLMDCLAPSDSTRVSSNSPSWSSPSFGSTSTVPDTTAPLTLFSNDYYDNASWALGKRNDSGITDTGGYCSPSPEATEAAVRQSPAPPTVQLHKLSLSFPSPYAPCGPVTFVPASTLVAPRPISSRPSLIGRAWPAQFQPPPVLATAFLSGSPPQPPPDIPPRPHMRAKIPPEKGRKPFPCLQPSCGMKFSKRNALAQ